MVNVLQNILGAYILLMVGLALHFAINDSNLTYSTKRFMAIQLYGPVIVYTLWTVFV